MLLFLVSGQYSSSEHGSAEAGISPQYSELASQLIIGGDGGGNTGRLDVSVPPHPVRATRMHTDNEVPLIRLIKFFFYP